MPKYLFDVKLFAAVRVVAPDLGAARDTMRAVIDGMDPGEHWIKGFNEAAPREVRITEVSLAEDGEDENGQPTEIDGEPQ